MAPIIETASSTPPPSSNSTAMVVVSIGRVFVDGRKERYRNGMERYGTGKNVSPFCYKRRPVFTDPFERVPTAKFPVFTVFHYKFCKLTVRVNR